MDKPKPAERPIPPPCVFCQSLHKEYQTILCKARQVNYFKNQLFINLPGPSRKKLIIKWAAIIFSSALLFLLAKDAAVKERGYTAFGGEYFILLVPFIYYVAERLIKDWTTILQMRCDENEL